MKHKIICGDCIEALREIEDNSIDSCVTDPPYGLEFMDKDWDYSVPSVKVWSEVFRVLKPGAYLLSFFGTRTYHRGVVNIEDAGFEIRDMILWLYGSGFPKSMDISKAIDKELGKLGEREIIGVNPNARDSSGIINICKKNGSRVVTLPSSIEAKKWEGWGTALKPACEPIVLAKKSISEHNIAQNVLKYGTGGLNIDGCRVVFQNKEDRWEYPKGAGGIYSHKYQHSSNIAKDWHNFSTIHDNLPVFSNPKGRFPANVILECCCEDNDLVEGKVGRSKIIQHYSSIERINKEENNFKSVKTIKYDNERAKHLNPNCVCRMLDKQSGVLKTGDIKSYEDIFPFSWKNSSKIKTSIHKGDIGGASRFFYQAKASQDERWLYCKICRQVYSMKERDNHIHSAPDNARYQHLEFHPTQKPLQLIQYLLRLVTPPHGTLIDPFMGTGTALVAAEREGFNSIGIDNKLEYCEIAIKRMEEEMKQLRINREPSTTERIGF